MSNVTWGEVIDNLESESFIGRKQELLTFTNEIIYNRKFIFYISGQGGVGKTTLLNHYKEIAENNNFITTYTDEQLGNIILILNSFSNQLEIKGYKLKKFDQDFLKFKQLKQEIESDPEAPEGLSSFLGQSIVKVGLVLADEVPILRQGSKLVDHDKLLVQTSAWASYFSKKWFNKYDEIELIKDPISNLTKTFFKDLNKLAKNNSILLSFDNYEITKNYLTPWLAKLRDYELSTNIRLIIASRTPPESSWEKFKSVILHVKLEEFTEEEAQEFLDLSGVTDKSKRKEIMDFSGRLPVLMSWLSSSEDEESYSTYQTTNIVDRFLRWVKNIDHRAFAVEASIPRFFNLDIIQALFPKNTLEKNRELFDWLIDQPFISEKRLGWQYHDVVRRHMLHYQRNLSTSHYKYLHELIANYYSEQKEKLALNKIERWNNDHWNKFNIDYIYHSVIESTDKNWSKFINNFIYIFKYKKDLAYQLIEIFIQPIVLDEFNEEKINKLYFFEKELKVIIKEISGVGIGLYNYLCSYDDLEKEAKSYVYWIRGKAHASNNNYDIAENDLKKSILINSDNYLANFSLGKIYSKQSKYNEALSHFDLSLKIKPCHCTYDAKGILLYNLKKYHESIETLTKAEETGRDCHICLAVRGASYLELGDFEKSLNDLNTALKLDENYAWCKIKKGEVYLKTKNYNKAIYIFEEVMKKNDDYDHNCLMNIGIAMFYQEKYKYSKKYLALSLDDSLSCSHCWSLLIKTCEKIYPREKIYNVLNAIEFNKSEFSSSAYYSRAISLAENSYHECINDIKKIQMDPINKNSSINEKGLYYSSIANYEEAISLFEKDNLDDSFVTHYNIAIATTLWKGVNGASSEIKMAEEHLNNLLKNDLEQKAIALYGLAGLFAVKKEKKKAFSLLEKSLGLDASLIFLASSDPAWYFLHSDSHFQITIKKIITSNYFQF